MTEEEKDQRGMRQLVPSIDEQTQQINAILNEVDPMMVLDKAALMKVVMIRTKGLVNPSLVNECINLRWDNVEYT